MMRTWFKQLARQCLGAVLVTAAGVVPGAGAQPADSTHVLGLAPQGIAPGTVPVAPRSVQQMLSAMAGAELYFREYDDFRSGYAELPAFIRVKVFADRAELQLHRFHEGWQPQCSATPALLVCQGNPYRFPDPVTLQLTVEGFHLSALPCPDGTYGTTAGGAYYSWEGFLAGIGAFAQQNRKLQTVANGYQGYWFQGGSFSARCS